MKNEKGITLATLVITIIILLILVVVSINLVINQGILDKSKYAVDKYSESETGEQAQLLQAENEMAKYDIKQVEYLESTGTQWIDTNFKVNSNTKVIVDAYQITRTYNSIFGVNPYFVITSYNSKYRFRYNGMVIDTTIVSSTRAILILDKNKAYINGELIGEVAEQIFETNYTALLFARHTDSGSIEECNRSRIYYCKIYDNNTLVRDYMPVLDENGVACLYDKVEKNFYYNQGTGEFKTNLDE